LKTDDQLWQIARLFRKAEAFDVLVDLLNERASLTEKLKQLERHSDHTKMVLYQQFSNELLAVEGTIARHIGRAR
jgi:hypothetical protein